MSVTTTAYFLLPWLAWQARNGKLLLSHLAVNTPQNFANDALQRSAHSGPCCRCQAGDSGKPFLKQLGEWGAKLFGVKRRQGGSWQQRQQSTEPLPEPEEASASATAPASAASAHPAQLVPEPQLASMRPDADAVHRQMQDALGEPSDSWGTDYEAEEWSKETSEMPVAPAGDAAPWDEWQEVGHSLSSIPNWHGNDTSPAVSSTRILQSCLL